MRKLYIFGLIALACIIIGLAWADQMTLSTYYPAPYGVYKDMAVMNRLGIGTTDSQAKLHILDSAGVPGTNPVPLRIGDGTAGNEFTMDIAAGQGLVSLVAGAQIKSDGTGYDFLGTRGASRIALHDGLIRFYTSDSTTGTAGATATGLTAGSDEKMFIDNSGVVSVKRFVIQKRPVAQPNPPSPQEGEIWLTP